MKINFDVEIPRSDAEDINALYKFAEVKITYEDKFEAISRKSVLKRVIDREGLSIEISRIDADVYCKKVGESDE